MSHDEEDKIEDLLVATGGFSQIEDRRDTIDNLPFSNSLIRK
jgi:hypothetical protein